MALKTLNFILESYLAKTQGMWNYNTLKALSVSSAEGDPLKLVTFKFVVQRDMCNKGGSMHGGAIMTLIDDVTTIALLGIDPKLRGQVTSNLHTRFLNAVFPGDELTVVAKNEKLGKSIGFASCEIFKETVLVASGSHTKLIVDIDIRDLKL
mmetsp:Transcript_21619/g.39534  ORF Transcript_21619/g.39534 Transcript_21619/m.39534 type:complete len:152 (+) Transcript_21619:659-1114(+)